MFREHMEHLQILDDLARELQDLIIEYNRKVNGQVDKPTLVAIRLEQNEALIDLLLRQRRALDYMAGNPIKPEVHFGEGVLIGTFGSSE